MRTLLTDDENERFDEVHVGKKGAYRRAYRGDCTILFPRFQRHNAIASPTLSPFTWMFEKCCVAHPTIKINPEILGGIPHIYGTRLSVGQILGRLYLLGSIAKVVKYYESDISEEDVKEAIAYAQDFVELAGDPESSETID